jgi:hypothetical protein
MTLANNSSVRPPHRALVSFLALYCPGVVAVVIGVVVWERNDFFA